MSADEDIQHTAFDRAEEEWTSLRQRIDEATKVRPLTNADDMLREANDIVDANPNVDIDAEPEAIDIPRHLAVQAYQYLDDRSTAAAEDLASAQDQAKRQGLRLEHVWTLAEMAVAPPVKPTQAKLFSTLQARTYIVNIKDLKQQAYMVRHEIEKAGKGKRTHSVC